LELVDLLLVVVEELVVCMVVLDIVEVLLNKPLLVLDNLDEDKLLRLDLHGLLDILDNFEVDLLVL
jgi:hypothetical protein